MTSPVCTHFAPLGALPACRIGRSPATEPCGPGCAAYLPDHERTPCEVYTRIMGYHRPISCANLGKQQEHRDRVAFKELPA